VCGAGRSCSWESVAWSITNTASGWIYPEDRDIAVLAIEGLDPERKAEFDRLWQEARLGDEKRLCTQGADTAQGVTPDCIDWAALSAIAGDHSCSSEDMLEIVRTSEWIPGRRCRGAAQGGPLCDSLHFLDRRHVRGWSRRRQLGNVPQGHARLL
jgi:hypothetical protein